MNQPTTVREVLDAMDIKFSDESKWTQGWYAKDKEGNIVPEYSPEAACWCLVGCAIAVSPDPTYPNVLNQIGRETTNLLYRLIQEKYTDPISMTHDWNDAPQRIFQDVKDLIQLAKERA